MQRFTHRQPESEATLTALEQAVRRYAPPLDDDDLATTDDSGERPRHLWGRGPSGLRFEVTGWGQPNQWNVDHVTVRATRVISQNFNDRGWHLAGRTADWLASRRPGRPLPHRPTLAPVDQSPGLKRALLDPNVPYFHEQDPPGWVDAGWYIHQLYCQTRDFHQRICIPASPEFGFARARGLARARGPWCVGACPDPLCPCTGQKLQVMQLVGIRDEAGWITRYGEDVEFRSRQLDLIGRDSQDSTDACSTYLHAVLTGPALDVPTRT